MKILTIFVFMVFFIPQFVSAEDVAKCDGIIYQSCKTIGNTNVWLIDSNDINTPKPGYIYQPNGCNTLLPGVQNKYRKCQDTNADTIPDIVVEMTVAEKTIIDAPAIAEAARQQAFTDEVDGTSGNDLCNAELSVITTKIDNIYNQLDSDMGSANNFASAKAVLLTWLTKQRAIEKKEAKCIRARAR